MTDELRSLYEQVVLDHNRQPRNFQHRPSAVTHAAHGFNPVCNDEFTVHLQIVDGAIRDVGFEGAGCAISTASCSLMTEVVKGKTVTEAEHLFRVMHRLLVDGVSADDLGKPAILAGVREFPMRVKCATLAWHVLHAALAGRSSTVSTENGSSPPPDECFVAADGKPEH